MVFMNFMKSVVGYGLNSIPGRLVGSGKWLNLALNMSLVPYFSGPWHYIDMSYQLRVPAAPAFPKVCWHPLELFLTNYIDLF